MQLPSALQHFPKPTLLILADQVLARFYLAHQDQVDEIDTIATPREWRTDREGSFVNTDHGSVNAPADHAEEERIEQHTRTIAERLTSCLTQTKAVHFHLVMRPELSRRILNHLSRPMAKKAHWNLDADLMKTSILEVIERLLPKNL